MAPPLEIDHAATRTNTHQCHVSHTSTHTYTIFKHSFLHPILGFPYSRSPHRSYSFTAVRFTVSPLQFFQETLFTGDSLFPPGTHSSWSPAQTLNLYILLFFLLLPVPTDLVLYVSRHGPILLTWAFRGFRGYTCCCFFFFPWDNNRLTSCDPGNGLLPPSLPLCDSAEQVSRSQGHFQRTHK